MPDTPARIGSFEVLRRVGAGGMGEVFLGTRPDGGFVAIKRLLRQASKDPVFVGMFLDEGRLARRLDHPHIARLYELGKSPEGHYLAIEWVDGGSVEELLAKARGLGPLPVGVACRIVADVAEALGYAHGLRGDDGTPLELVHRDVSPANVLVSFTGHAKLLDFGLAKARTQLQKTEPGMVKGKFGYLAPEQLGGRLDARTDLFSLGLVLWELLAGRRYFDQATAAATVAAARSHAVCTSVRTLRPDVPEALDEVLRQVTAGDADARPATAAAFRAALEAAAPLAPREELAERVRASFPERRGERNRGSLLELDPVVSEPAARRRWPALLLVGAAVLAAVAFALTR
ncbi:MAG: serine/threonine-protein kinase [Myxococcota bacterium]